MIREQQLEMLGLKPKEARLYLAALPLGYFTVTQIASQSGIKRTTCYIILDELTTRGLISVTPKGKKSLYKVGPPDALIKRAKQSLNYAEKFVPFLRPLFKEEKGAPVIKFYYGQKGIQNIYEDTLNIKEKTVYYVASTKQHLEMAGEDFMRDFVKRRIAKKIKSISIRMRSEEINEDLYIGNKEHLREVRYAPTDIYIPDTVMLYSNKVAIVSTVKESFGFIIESTELYQTLLGFFQALWRISNEK